METNVLKKILKDDNMTIGWIGLGKCGLPIADAIGKLCNVIAYDLIPKHTKHATYTNNIADLLDTSIVFVLVQTPNKVNLNGNEPIDFSSSLEDFDYTAVRSVLADLTNVNYTGIVVLSSTVSPGTTKTLAKQYPTLNLIYMPVMIHIGKEAETFLSSPLYYIGTADGKPVSLLTQFLLTNTTTTEVLTGTYDEVELYKMIGNLYCSLKVAFSNTVSELVETAKLNASSFNIMNALHKDTVRFNSPMYLKPGSGDGGPCHPRDGVVMTHLMNATNMESKLIKSIAETREQQAFALAKYLATLAPTVVILGKSFKPGTDLTDGSYSVLVGNYCTRLGMTVLYDTDIVTDHNVAVLVTHMNKRILDNYNFPQGSVVVDLWNQGLSVPNESTLKVYGDNLIK
jgi:UDPglucose 6-dehydrogenase